MTTALSSTPLDRRTFLRSAAMVGVGAACAPDWSWSVEGDVLHIRTYNDIKSLDPVSMLSGSTGLIAGAIYLNLVRFRSDGSWDWQLDAAEHFEQTSPVTYDVRLREGIRFSNGFGEMTADDVKFSLERIVDPDMKSPNAGDMGTLQRVDVRDRYSGTIRLTSPFAAFVPIGLCAMAGAILSRKAVESVGGRFGVEPPCSSGPYRFVDWQAQRKTVIEQNPAWQGVRPAFRQIHIYPLTDVKSAELAYEAGELDCTQVSVESVEVFRRRMPRRSRLEVMSSLRYYWVGINQDHPRLRDIRVRRAVQWGIDVEAVLEAAWFGLATPATGIIAPGLIGHREKTDIPLAGDRETARRLLEEAGVDLPLELTLAVPSDSLEMTAAQVVQWSLGKVGIEVELQPQDNATLITLGMESAGDRWRDLQLHIQSFFMLGDPYYATEWFVSEQVGIWNWERFRSDEFDRLHEVALGLTDPAERDPLYRRMQHLMEASGCYRFLAHDVEAMLSRRWLTPAYRADGYPTYRDFSLASDGEG
jgi:peptide/nickel transport system substrate-binding protein